jgi:hypothetical protein
MLGGYTMKSDKEIRARKAEWAREYRKKNRDLILAKRRISSKNPEEKKKHADYQREYTRKHSDRINARRRERRLERIADGEDVKLISRLNNKRYYEKNKDEIKAREKARNWNYNPEKARENRKRYRDAFPGRTAITARRSWAKKRGVLFTLDNEWYVSEWDKGCSMTGIIFDSSGANTPWVAHIDRIVPGGGYTKENCRLVCACYNQAKQNWVDADVLKMARELLEFQAGIINRVSDA